MKKRPEEKEWRRSKGKAFKKIIYQVLSFLPAVALFAIAFECFSARSGHDYMTDDLPSIEPPIYHLMQKCQLANMSAPMRESRPCFPLYEIANFPVLSQLWTSPRSSGIKALQFQW